jgi:hypothetical protein
VNPPQRRGLSQRGQGLVELAILAPVLVLLFLGVSTAAAFLNDRQIAGQATRAGARLGAEIGNAGYFTGAPTSAACQASAKDPCQVDNEIVRSTITVARGFTNVPQIKEVDIYDPCNAGGGSCASGSSVCPYSGVDGSVQNGQPTDVYKPNGSGVFILSGTAGFTLDLRSDSHPNETPIGVRIVYAFQASAPMTFFNYTTSEYATMCLAPIQSGG